MWLLASFELSAMKRKLKADAKPMRDSSRLSAHQIEDLDQGSG
jgi:hypothetical protein